MFGVCEKNNLIQQRLTFTHNVHFSKKLLSFVYLDLIYLRAKALFLNRKPVRVFWKTARQLAKCAPLFADHAQENKRLFSASLCVAA